jgi:hypothetical protein
MYLFTYSVVPECLQQQYMGGILRQRDACHYHVLYIYLFIY